jgi:hypothetical protein
MEKSVFSRLSLGKTQEMLEQIGIVVKKSNGDMRSYADILNDLALKWNSLNNTTQQQIALQMAKILVTGMATYHV